MNADVANKLASIARVMVKGAELPAAFDAEFGAGSFARVTARLDDELFQRIARPADAAVPLPNGAVGAIDNALRELRAQRSVEHHIPDALKIARDVLEEALTADRELTIAREALRQAQRQRNGSAVPAKRVVDAAELRRDRAFARLMGVV